MRKYNIEFKLKNSSSSEVTLHVEPWGDQLAMARGQELTVRGDSNEPGLLEVEIEDGNIVLWAWDGSALKIFDGDEEIS